MAIEVDGTESEVELGAIKALAPVVVLLNTGSTASRIHASRRVFDAIRRHEITTPVVHYARFESSSVK